jgi:hypothetical protein
MIPVVGAKLPQVPDLLYELRGPGFVLRGGGGVPMRNGSPTGGLQELLCAPCGVWYFTAPKCSVQWAGPCRAGAIAKITLAHSSGLEEQGKGSFR